jgi:hypothetical protein
MLDNLFVAGAVAAVGEALASAHADEGTVAVIGNARLAGALAKNRTTLAVGLSARAAKKIAGAVDDLAGVEPRSLAAVIAVDVATDDAWEAALREWTRVIRDGGAIVLVDRGHAPEASRRALCGGLTELEQRRAGRSIVTSGLVSHLV